MRRLLAGALDLVWSPLGPRSHSLLKAMLATGRCLWNEVSGPVLSEGAPVQASVDVIECVERAVRRTVGISVLPSQTVFDRRPEGRD